MHSDDHAPFMPQRFKVIISALLLVKEVNNDISIINQNPAVGWSPLDASGHPPSLLFGLNLHSPHQSPQLRFGLTATDDKKISEDGLGMDIQHKNVDALFILQGVNN